MVGDPAPGGLTPQGTPLGKTKRIRAVFSHATDVNPGAGLDLGVRMVSELRAYGCFSALLPTYAGQNKVKRLRTAFGRVGYTLDDSGVLRPAVIDNLTGTELTTALRSYIDRLNLNPDDTALQIGTGKELDEATARHVLVEHFGEYPEHANFPVTLAAAFTALGWSVPGKVHLAGDPHQQFQQCLYLLALATNHLRNDAGTGHGRPGSPRRTPPLTAAQSRTVARATALTAGEMLDALQPLKPASAPDAGYGGSETKPLSVAR